MALVGYRNALSLAIALFCAGGLCWPASPAGAQASVEAGAAGDEASRARAIELFRQSAERYREGRFDEAAALLREARALHPEPLLSYNLARALEGAGDLEGAVDAYREYLDEAPDARDASAVRARLEGLERHLAEVRALEAERARLRAEAEAQARTEDVERGERDRSAAPRGPDAVPWVIAGGGAGVMIASAVTGALAIARRDDAARAPSHAATVAAMSDAEGLATATNVLLGVGGAAVLVGAIWGSVDLVSIGGQPRGDHAAARVRVGPASIEIVGRF